MSGKVINKLGELKVTTTDVTTLESRLLEGVNAVEEILIELKRANIYLSVLAGEEITNIDTEIL